MIKNIKYKYLKLLFVIFASYLIFLFFIRLINIYTIIFFIILIITLYNLDKKLVKKIVYKLIYKNKTNTISVKNKFKAAKISLDGIGQINKQINDKVKLELLNYEKNKLESVLKIGDYNVTLFGAGSTGKTSIARSLLKSIIGKTSPAIGTTKEISSYKIRIPILKRNINIIDTPGLFEAFEDGEKRERLTILKASGSDLVLFVLDQDINKYEHFLIKELSNLGKKIIIVLNKCDLRSDQDNNTIIKNIRAVTSTKKNNISVVKAVAVRRSSSNNNSLDLNLIPEVTDLFKEIINTLDECGEELLADNILFRSNKLGIKSKKLISEQRYISANKIINKYIWITGSVILVNPLPSYI